MVPLFVFVVGSSWFVFMMSSLAGVHAFLWFGLIFLPLCCLKFLLLFEIPLLAAEGVAVPLFLCCFLFLLLVPE